MENLHIYIDNSILCKYNLNMSQNNICLFPQSLNKTNDDNLTILNLVKETDCKMNNKFVTQAVFRMHLVYSGEGTINTAQGKYKISSGDLFVTFPAMPYFITNDNSLEFMYISFLGTRAYQILDSININKNSSIIHNNHSLIELWNAVFKEANNVALAGEGLLLITVSKLSNNDILQEKTSSATLANDIQHLINENLSNPKLSLSFISEKLSYNEKYISLIFKKNFNTTIQNYIEDVRMNNAYNLIESGITSVKEMAKFCGYKDPLYFSKVFKKKIGLSPSEFSKHK